MNRTLAGLTILAGALALAPQVQARPYLMLAADNQGFEALDLGGIHLEGVDAAQITVVDAPLAGVRFGDKVAALMKQRLEFECQGTRWRTLSISYADAKEAALGDEPAPADWREVADYPLLATAKDAACLHRYKQTLVSRDLNLGDIITNYHKAWGPAAPEPMTRQQLLRQHFDASH